MNVSKLFSRKGIYIILKKILFFLSHRNLAELIDKFLTDFRAHGAPRLEEGNPFQYCYVLIQSQILHVYMASN